MIDQILQELSDKTGLPQLPAFVVGGIAASVALSLALGLPVALFFSRKGSFVNRVCWGLQKYTIFTVSLFALPFAVIAFFTHDSAHRLPLLSVVVGSVFLLSLLVWKFAPKPLGKDGPLLLRILE